MQLVVNALLLAVYTAVPFAVLAAGNRSEVKPGEILLPYLVVLLPLLVIVVAIAVFKGPAATSRFGPPVAVAILFTFDYRELHGVYGTLAAQTEQGMVAFWISILVLLVLLVWRLARRTALLSPALLAAGLVMLIPPVATYADYSLSVRVDDAAASRWTHRLRPAQQERPDVLFLMLDAYGRPDYLRKQLDYSDAPFVAYLRSKGFVIPSHSRPAYAFTALSVPSMLQMDYVAKGPEAANLEQARDAIAGRNRVVSAFRSMGYAYAYAPSEYSDWTCRGYQDICLRPSSVSAEKLGVSEFQWAMIEKTPLADALKNQLPSTASEALADGRQFPSRVVRALAARPVHRPLLTVAHVLLAHPPYLYHGRDCRYRYTAANTGQGGRNEYLTALRCVNTDTERAIDMWLKSHPNGVIVISSDHGSDVDVNHYVPEWHWTPEVQQRRFANFVALRLPRQCRSRVPDDFIEVNLFRVVLNCVSDANLPLLPARRYLVNQPTGAIRQANTLMG